MRSILLFFSVFIRCAFKGRFWFRGAVVNSKRTIRDTSIRDVVHPYTDSGERDDTSTDTNPACDTGGGGRRGEMYCTARHDPLTFS